MTDPTDDLSTVLQYRFVLSERSDTVFEVAVVEGPDTGTSVLLDQSLPGALLVGKSPVCGLQLTDPAVSRRHLSLELRGEELRLLDLGSKNRTLINDVAIESAYLRGGEVIRIGSSAIKVTPHAG